MPNGCVFGFSLFALYLAIQYRQDERTSLRRGKTRVTPRASFRADTTGRLIGNGEDFERSATRRTAHQAGSVIVTSPGSRLVVSPLE